MESKYSLEKNQKAHYDMARNYINQGNLREAKNSLKKSLQCIIDLAEISAGSEKNAYVSKGNSLLDLIRDIDRKIEALQNTPPAQPAAKKGTGGQEQGRVQAIRAEAQSDITFQDVAGLQDVKDQIRYKVLEPLKNPELAALYKIEPGAKILLYGPPGTGKTFIARAIAGEVEATFYAVNCQDLISKYMGDSSKKLDELFDEAQKNERAIIFFDEFDSVASKRSDGSDGVDAEMARFVATFLTKVDGFKKSETNKMLLLIAATNRPWALDSAMLRGGRFDTHIYIGVPDQSAREFLVNKVLKGLPMDEDVRLPELARLLDGYGGGDITAICGKIKLAAYMRSLQVGAPQNITRKDCEDALASSHNMITAEDLAKFERFRLNGSID